MRTERAWTTCGGVLARAAREISRARTRRIRAYAEPLPCNLAHPLPPHEQGTPPRFSPEPLQGRHRLYLRQDAPRRTGRGYRRTPVAIRLLGQDRNKRRAARGLSQVYPRKSKELDSRQIWGGYTILFWKSGAAARPANRICGFARVLGERSEATVDLAGCAG